VPCIYSSELNALRLVPRGDTPPEDAVLIVWDIHVEAPAVKLEGRPEIVWTV
jgi:hypothetical protein